MEKMQHELIDKNIEDCAGYQKLLAAVQRDENRSPGFHDYRGKLIWVVERAKQYSEIAGLTVAEILSTWEDKRTYWYMNYYQECNQPEIKAGKVRIFKTVDELLESFKNTGFRCPGCGGVSKNPYECDSGWNIDGKICDWKSYGFLRCLGKGVSVFVIEKLQVETFFMPIAWENTHGENDGKN